MAATPDWWDTSYGNQADKYGGADLVNMLFNRKGDDRPSVDTVKSYLSQNKETQWSDPNDPNQLSPLLKWLNDSDIRANWGSGSPSDESTTKFQGADLEVAKWLGHSNTDIKNWLDDNQGTLTDKDKPGGGGLYDVLIGDIATEDAQAKITDLETQREQDKLDWEAAAKANTEAIQGYKSNIEDLTTQMSGMLTQADFDTKIGELQSSYTQQLTDAGNLRITAPTAIGGSSAAGVKIKQSDKFAESTKGTKQLSRGYRNNPMAISSLNVT